ncbi:hypothetical protein ONR75_18520 [Rhodopseudomonas sp. P2A-2r]|uniref:hypothetical protein n=1 Tax=Rhodopseudomonas sp. P2A-2r TaxID=2991972 RepID=UPI0022345B9C|nr:hypothetical protein [Rhodopseudomonas sp. P2A-2r]UZE46999.1 hypothetical protein ONR75_18520 [Rhodopseudomonas sp. P2A-2r]
MAKSSAPKTTGTSKIRFILVEAEIADDQIQSVTQAITNALRGPAATQTIKRIAAPSNGAEEHQEIEGEAEEVLEDEAVEAPVRARSTTPRKTTVVTPELLDIDFDSYEVPLVSFASNYKTDGQVARYLLVCAWFQEHGGVAKVTPSHVYSAFKWLKWTSSAKDFAQPLRQLKSDELLGSSEKGTYTINHVGLKRVAELKNSNAA